MVDSWEPAAVNDEKVHAHGGQILHENGFWYFIGEDRRGRSRVSIYRSRDFISWERRYTFTLDAAVDNSFPGRDTTLEGGACGRCNLERPKIIRSRRSGRYVMWMHFEYENDYREARLASAWADSVEGPYFYTGSFRPLGNMSRDLNVFTDDDGQAYIISTTDDNRTLNIYALDDEAMSVREKTASLFPSRYREAPVLFKKDGLYHLITSGCTGWKPNQGMYSWSHTLSEGWNELVPFGDSTTFDSQPTSVFEKDGKLMYLGDRWGGDRESYFRSTYVILPLRLEDGVIEIGDEK